MAFQLREHTADVGVAAQASSLAAVFADIAAGFTAAMCDEWPDSGERFDFSVSSESGEALLFDYLDELIYQRDVRNVLPVDHDVTITGRNGTWSLEASSRGVPLTEVDAREIKAVTYSDMRLRETSDGWRAHVVFDV